jgi:hypothetical protein
MKKPALQLRLRPLALGILATVASGLAEAKDLGETTGLVDYLSNGADTQFGSDWGIKWGGWANFGITYNAEDPAGRYNGPVTFGDRDSEFQLNQFYLYLQRSVDTEAKGWDFGFRADFLFGTDAVFTQAYGCPSCTWDLGILAQEGERFYDIAFPQAYVEVFAPFGNGITAKIGHFYTIIGNEVVTAPDNFFYSHAYTMQYGEPFTHTGVLLSYPLNDNWTLTGGGVTASITGGWDGGFDKGLGNWNFLGGVTWTSDSKGTSVAVTGTAGDTSEHVDENWSMYSIVLKHDIVEGLHFTLQHDHGFADKAVADASGNLQDTEWYGINSYLTYDIFDNLGAGIRFEWFRDDDGFRIFSPARTLTYAPGANSYYALTAGLNWKPLNWVTVRPNVRYDWAEDANAFDNGHGDTGFAAKKDTQFLFSTDVVISF